MPADITENPSVPQAVERAKQRFSIIGNSPALTDAILRAIKVAPIDLSVLVIGESGTGKEFFPRLYTPPEHASIRNTSPSIAARYLKAPSTPNFSVTRKGPSPEL